MTYISNEKISKAKYDEQLWLLISAYSNQKKTFYSCAFFKTIILYRIN